MAHDVFICHASSDKPIADRCCSRIESHGIRCWIAQRDIEAGQDWPSKIIDAIGSVKVLVLVYTARSNESEQVKREVERAVSRGLPIIPLRVEDVQLSKHMEYFISTPHWLDAITPPLEAHLDSLADTVKRLIDDTNEPFEGKTPFASTQKANVESAPAKQATWTESENRVLRALYPILRVRDSVLNESKSSIPFVAAILALLVGILSLYANIPGFFRALSPVGDDAIFYQFLGAFRPLNLIGAVVNVIGGVLLLIGARRMFAKAGGGANVAVSASVLLASWTAIWFFAANGIVLSSKARLPSSNDVLSGVYTLSALSLLQVGAVWFFARRSR